MLRPGSGVLDSLAPNRAGCLGKVQCAPDLFGVRYRAKLFRLLRRQNWVIGIGLSGDWIGFGNAVAEYNGEDRIGHHRVGVVSDDLDICLGPQAPRRQEAD